MKNKNETYQSAGGTNDKSFDVPMHQLLKRIVGVCTVDNGAVGILVVGCLGTEFATKEFVDLSGKAMQAVCDSENVWNRCFDSVSGTFDFSKDGGHFVTVFRIIDRGSSGDVDNGSSTKRHDGQCLCSK